MGLGKILRGRIAPTGTAILFAVLGVAASSGSASAYVICNNEGDCWHSDQRENIPGVNLEIHPDDWYFHQEWGRFHRFREYHDGRGYWHNGVWVQL